MKCCSRSRASISRPSTNGRTASPSGDWSSFPPAERAAFAFARKQARDPASVTDADVHELVELFGRERTIDVIWWACRCHYMTRVADAFQLPLERENVFDAGTPPKKP